MKKKIELSGSGEMMKTLFEMTYPHIHLCDTHKTNQLINRYALEVENGMDSNKALDLLQDAIMSQGLAGYDE